MKKLPLFLRIALQTAANNSKINSKYVLAFAAFGALLGAPDCRLRQALPCNAFDKRGVGIWYLV